MAYTPTSWVEGVTTLGPTNMNKIETELAYLDARIAPAALGYGTTLPGSPVDGQEAILVNSTTTPTYQWRFRYNAGSSSAYKWEFVGGPPAWAEVVTLETAGVVAYTDIATVGPSFTLPRSGDYVYTLAVQVGNDTATGGALAAVKLGAAATADVDCVYLSPVTASGLNVSVATTRRINGATSGDVWKVQYRAAAAGTAYFANRRLSVIPARVS